MFTWFMTSQSCTRGRWRHIDLEMTVWPQSTLIWRHWRHLPSLKAHDVTNIVYYGISRKTVALYPGTTLLARCPGKCLVTSFLVTSSKWAQLLHSQEKVILPGYSSFWFSVYSLLYIYKNLPSVNITCLDIKLSGLIGANMWKMLIGK